MSYLSPGVYIEEVPSGPQPIAAAPTSVVAVLGNLRKGPLLRPTRVTGWSDFVRTFGSAHAGGCTAESVYGYFENGGPAAWVVRVDPSTAARWTVRDADDVTSFRIDASSAGSWASHVGVRVLPYTEGGNGSLFDTAVLAAATIGSGTEAAVAVESTTGVRVGDLVTVARADGTSSNAEVRAVTPAEGSTPASLTLLKTGADVSLRPHDRVAIRVDAGTTTLTLTAAKGFRSGDLLVARLADGTRVSAVVDSVATAGIGMVLTLTAPLSTSIPGVALDDRIARFRARVTAPTTAVALADLTFDGDPTLVPTTNAALAGGRATAANGRSAAFDSTANAYVFAGDPPPSGTFDVEARLRVVRFAESGISVTDPTPEVVASRYGFLPDGTSITLTVGANNATFTRSGDTFSTTDVTTHTFTSARFDLPTDPEAGIVVRSAEAPRVGEYVRVGTTNLRIAAVHSPGGSVHVLTFDPGTPIPASTATSFALRTFTPAQLSPQRFTLAVDVSGVEAERFVDLALDPGHARYYARDGLVNGVSTILTVSPRAGDAPALGLAAMPAHAALTQEGTDVAPTTKDYKDGLEILETVSEPAMVICPDTVTFTDPMLQADLVGSVVQHCEEFRRYAIIDAPDLPDTDLLSWRNQYLASTYAALVAPHVTIVSIDPDSTERFRTVPPSGFVAGVFARTDRERGVHKAPGNERVSGIVGLSQQYTTRRQDLLNPASVNLIRAFPGRGTRLWGARNATDDVTWRYVNVRRLFNMVEESVENGTQWVVFEPNTAATWIRIKVSLENFLEQLWRAGALAGTSPEQAFRVRVGLGETMTETDIDLGLVITEVAIAPAKPAEFVVFRFSHKRLSE